MLWMIPSSSVASLLVQRLHHPPRFSRWRKTTTPLVVKPSWTISSHAGTGTRRTWPTPRPSPRAWTQPPRPGTAGRGPGSYLMWGPDLDCILLHTRYWKVISFRGSARWHHKKKYYRFTILLTFNISKYITIHKESDKYLQWCISMCTECIKHFKDTFLIFSCIPTFVLRATRTTSIHWATGM